MIIEKDRLTREDGSARVAAVVTPAAGITGARNAGAIVDIAAPDVARVVGAGVVARAALEGETAVAGATTAGQADALPIVVGTGAAPPNRCEDGRGHGEDREGGDDTGGLHSVG
jgi:hypothetical protein